MATEKTRQKNRNKGFITGGAVILMAAFMLISLSLFTGLNLISQKERFSADDLKARCLFEKKVLLSIDGQENTFVTLPEGYTISTFETQDRLIYRLYYLDDMRDEFWTERKE